MTFALSLVVKSSVVLAAACVAARASRRSSAATRHALWSLAIACLAALPLLSIALPALELPVLPAESDPPAHTGPQVPLPALHAEPLAAPDVAVAAGVAPVRWVGTLWLIGVGLGWAHLAFGLALAARAVRGARRVDDPHWPALLAAARARLGIRREVALRVSEATDVPIVWGDRSPVILLPPHALDWPGERRRTMLLHEVAHVARFDCSIQALAYAVRAFYWPHPLAWWAVAALRRESEKACDDRVVESGAAAVDYAGHLLEAARARPHSRHLAVAAAGAERTHLGARVGALLDERRDRRRLSRRAAVLAGGAALMASLALATARPVRAGSPGAQAAEPPPAAGWIVHDPIGCVVEGRYARIDARIEPAPEEARLYFSAGRAPEGREFWVAMTREGDRYVARLPKPQKKASPVRYRIEARGADGRVAGTDRYHVTVAPDASRCPGTSRVAPESTAGGVPTVHRPTDAPPAPPPADPTLEDWIRHAPVGCLVQGRFAEIDAEIAPASDVAEARVYFSSGASPGGGEYWTLMSRVGERFVARLPKPRLEAGWVDYRIEARRADGRLASTDHLRAVVASAESTCPEGSRIARQAGSAEPVTVY